LSVCYHARLEKREEYEDGIVQLFTGSITISNGVEQFRDEIRWYVMRQLHKSSGELSPKTSAKQYLLLLLLKVSILNALPLQTPYSLLAHITDSIAGVKRLCLTACTWRGI
jgi:hypothetical protein